MVSAAHHQIWRDHRAMSLLGMGVALPGEPVGSGELLERVQRNFGVDVRRAGTAIARRLAIESRHICRDLVRRHESPRSGDTNAELCARALRLALAEAELRPNDLSYLIAHTTSPGRLLPPNVAQVVDLLEYRGPFLELRQACTGFANALVIAQGLLSAPQSGPVAIVGSETGSAFFDPLRVQEDSGQLVNMLQMGDGAAACVLTRESSQGTGTISHVYFGHAGVGETAGFSLDAGGSDFAADVERPREFTHDFARVGDRGLSLFEKGLEAARALEVDTTAVDCFIPHQANGRMSEILADQLGIAPQRVFVNANRLGNTGSAAIWLALAELRTKLGRGDSVLVLGAEATKYMFGGFRYVHT